MGKVNLLKAPFPYFGGKRRVAHIVWPRIGDTLNYVEPFAGSLAVLLSRPFQVRTETVNDIYAYLSNFWRAVQHDPSAVAYHADWPVNEADLHARHLWLVNQHDFRERMMTEPDYYDAKIAGWWVWGISAWIGSGWCDVKEDSRPRMGDSGAGIHKPSMTRNGRSRPNLRPNQGIERLPQKRPNLQQSANGQGKGVFADYVSKQIPHVGNMGRVNPAPSRQKPKLWTEKIHSRNTNIYDYMLELQDRLRRTRVCCGDWTRIMGKSVTYGIGTTAVFLDPPYNKDANRQGDLYAHDDEEISTAVRQWAIENGDNPKLRIALCGYESEHGDYMPDSWECVAWKANGGYSNQSKSGNDNASQERIWFSPHCLDVGEQLRNFWV